MEKFFREILFHQLVKVFFHESFSLYGVTVAYFW